jgi:hypothetical protein
MIAAPPLGDGPAPPVFPPRRTLAPANVPAAPVSSIEAYLGSLERSLQGQLDPALEADGILTPLGAVARAALLEQIGADLEAAVRDLMLSGVPRERAEEQAIAGLGPAPLLGRDLLFARRRRAVEAWQRRRDSIWWWTEPVVPVVLVVFAVLMAALAPTVGIMAGMAAERHLGVLAVALVPLVGGLITWAAGSVAADVGGRPPQR